MVTVQGPWWTLLIAAGLQLCVELSVHVREALRDRRFWRARRPRFRQLPEAWSPESTRRLGAELARRRKS